MLHHLRLNDQRQEKQVNWHSPETLSWRIEAACLQTVKIFSLKLCSKKFVQYVIQTGCLKLKPDRTLKYFVVVQSFY